MGGRKSKQPITSALATGGRGNVFENEVAAYFLSCMLACKPLFGERGGVIKKVSFQQKNQGWLLDDIVLTLQFGTEQRQCAFSVKSNQQFKNGGAPADFVEVVWRQVLEGSPPFNKNRDCLGIVLPPLPAGVHQAVTRVHEQVRALSPEDLAARLEGDSCWPSKPQRSLIDSFACPAIHKDEAKKLDTGIGTVLSRIEILELVFDGASPLAMNEALSNCRDALAVSVRSSTEAQALWESLYRLADKYRPREGSLDVAGLVALLRLQHKLLAYPDHLGDWEKLKRASDEFGDRIPQTLGGSLVLPRSDEISRLNESASQHSFVAVVGDSGTGKTALVKRLADSSAYEFSLMLDAAALNSGNWQQRVMTALSIPLDELFAAVTWSRAMMFVDGLEHVHTADGFRTLVALFEAASRVPSVWSVVVTCQASSWNRVLEGLRCANFGSCPWAVEELGELSDDDLVAVARRFPSLRGAITHPRLRSILGRVKVLSLLASRVEQSNAAPDTSTWVGELNIVEWFWQHFVGVEPAALARSAVLQKLGTVQADELSRNTPVAELEARDLALIGELARDGICVVLDESVAFSHDLIGDWSRQRTLLGKRRVFAAFAKERVPKSPVWNQAIRLHGANILDKEGFGAWKSLYDQVRSLGAEGTLLAGLLFDSLYMARSCESVLSEALALLQADGGTLLRSFLGRFLHFGTIPNLADSGQGDARSIALGSLDSFRLPIRTYWLPVLRFLAKNAGVAAGTAPTQVARIADIWLRSTAMNAPMRHEAAELALAVNDAVYSSGGGARAYVVDELSELVWRATLAGIAEKPEEVATLARAACGRGIDEMPHPDGLPDWFDMATWPGPFVCPASSFRKVCLETDALAPMMAFRPELAEELILACSIDEPPRFDPMDVNSPLDTIDLGLAHGIDWNPPFYTRGPFLRFLRESPEHGMRVICRLADFACEWMQRRDEEEGTRNLEICTDGSERQYIHTPNSFCWYTGVCGGPDGVVSALMALEHWGHQRTESGEMNEAILLSLLKEARSTSVVGVVTSIAKRNPRLLAGALRPLLAVPELLIADSSVAANFEISSMLLGWDHYTPAGLLELVKKWHSMRKTTPPLESIAIPLMLESEEMATFFAEVRLAWQARFLDPEGHLPMNVENLVAKFNPQNWFPCKDGKGDEWMQLRLPQDVVLRRKPGLDELNRRMEWQHFPGQCRQALAAEPVGIFGDPSQVLEKLRMFTAESPPQGLEHRGFAAADAVLGGVAVLVDRHWDWLDSQPSHLAWCTKQLDDCLGAIHPEPSQNDGLRLIAADGWTWDVFSAHVAARFWMKAPSVLANRQRLSRLVLDEHPAVIETIFNVLGSGIGVASPDLTRLQVMALRWAVAKTAIRKLPGPEAAEVSHRWREKEAASFVDAVLPACLCKFEEMVRAVYEDLSSLIEGAGDCRLAAVRPDIKVFLAAVGTRGTAARTLSNKAGAIDRMWAEAMNWTIATADEGERRTRRRAYGPSKWEEAVFKEAGGIAATSSDDQLSQSLAQSALGLTSEVHDHLTQFLRGFVNEGFLHEASYPMFVRHWQRLVDTALASPIWGLAGSAKSSDGRSFQEFWEHVLAFDWVSRSSLTKFAAPVLAFMCDRFVGFVGQILPFFDTPDGFMSFMCTDAASPLRLPVLRALASAVEAHPLLMERTAERSSESLAALLVRIWEAHRFEMTERAEVRRDVWAMLGPLLERQNRIAVELARAMEQVGSYG